MASRPDAPLQQPVYDGRVLHLVEDEGSCQVAVDSPAWFAWLRDPVNSSFLWRTPAGVITVRRASGDHGAIWHITSPLAQSHVLALGTADEVTRERLDAVAAMLPCELVPAVIQPRPLDGGQPPRLIRLPEERLSSLPAPLTSFVGREDELGAIERLLMGEAATTRLLTLTGAGGCGKTRLALAVAARVMPIFRDGAHWVELAGLTDPGLVPHAVATVVGLREVPGQTMLETLRASLRARRLLLVLDNCEHLIDACASLAEAVLTACPHARILTTSREPLGITGEVVRRVPSLAAPPESATSPDEIASYESVRLFLERAVAMRPDFALTAGNAPLLARLCRRLDGIPLALELAAARLRVLTIDQIVARLDDLFRLLTSGSRTALPRHRTLQATIDWSHELLTEQERTLLRRLAVFAEGATLAAIEAVCAGDDLDATDILDPLTALVDKSLARMEERGAEARYWLLEIVRQYALERLRLAGEEHVTRGRHLDWCLTVAEQSEAELSGPAQLQWLARLQDERANMRAALAWCVAEDPAAGLRLAGHLWQFWRIRWAGTEGRRWLSELIALAPQGTSEQAKALLGAGILAVWQGDAGAGRASLEASLTLSRAVRDRATEAWALRALGTLLLKLDERVPAMDLLREALALSQTINDRRGLGIVPYLMGVAASRDGNIGQARALMEESLALLTATGDEWLMIFPLTGLGRLLHATGEVEPAGSLFRHALMIAEKLGGTDLVTLWWAKIGWVAPWQGDLDAAARYHQARFDNALAAEDQPGVALSLIGLGWVAHQRGDGVNALALLRESLTTWLALGSRPGLAAALAALATVVAERASEPEGIRKSVRLLAAANALLEAWTPHPPLEREAHEGVIQAIRSRLPDAEFVATWTAGRSLSLDLAVEEALELDLPLATAPPAHEPPISPATTTTPGATGTTPAAAPGLNALTPRELMVLRQIAAGHSSQEIARHLAVSVRTVERHITNLYGKINARNRAEATLYALRHGLS